MVDQGVHIVITNGTRGRHVEASPTLLHASDYYMEPMCTFLSSHRTIKAGNYFSALLRLPLADPGTRDYIYPHKNCTVDQCAANPGIQLHINRIKEYAFERSFLDAFGGNFSNSCSAVRKTRRRGSDTGGGVGRSTDLCTSKRV